MRGILRLVVALVALVVLAVAPAARSAPPSDLQLVTQGLKGAAAREWLDPLEVQEYGEIADRAARVIPRLPGSRAANLAAVLRDVAALRAWYTRPRSLALFSMLAFNTQYLARRAMPPARADVYDGEGVLYRSFPGHGLQFHPLGNFARLAGLAAGHKGIEADVLARALVDRAVAKRGGLTWEYYFPFGGGRAPWTSGMAQAVAAGALARVGYPDYARRAYLAIPGGLLAWQPAGPWVRLYSFSSALVLNAQLQSVLSLQTYGRLTGEAEATALSDRLLASSVALLPRFDTGAWSLYALGGAEAPLEYHRYVVDLLGSLARQRPTEGWGSWQARFDRYLRQPPVVSARRARAAVPGVRTARISFWLSKRSRVVLMVAGAAAGAVWLSRGAHTLAWDPGSRRPGAYRASLAAEDLAGNRITVALPRVVVKRSPKAR